MRNAVAFANNDIVTVAWSYGQRPDGCTGFAIYRIDSQGKETALPSHAVFKGDTIQPGQTTAEFPVQKFYWKDPFARPIGEKTGSHNLGYQASYNNDENLVMIKGNKRLAMAYATHVLDVYDHFAWRWSVRNGTKGYDATLKSTPDEWLSWYLDAKGKIKTAQLKFWMQAIV